MKICAIGDPHGDIEKIKKIPLDNSIDLILVTGDLGSSDIMREMAFENYKRKEKGLDEIQYSLEEEKEAIMETFDSSVEIVTYLSQFAPVKTIYGNVETPITVVQKLSQKMNQNLPYLSHKLNKLGIDVFNNRIRRIGNIKIGGLRYFIDTNWVEDFDSKNKQRMIQSQKYTLKAQKILHWFNKLDILVCHQPPYGFLDKVNFKDAPKHWQGKNAGSKLILDYIEKQQPKYVFCGHIHEGEGEVTIGNSQIFNLGQGGYKIIEI